jgi:acyl-CoA thioester hydrolase
MEKHPRSTVKVRFQDCDPFNHLNNAAYLDYFINAREDQLLEHYNLDIFAYTKELGRTWVVGSNQILYLKPAGVMETVIIESKLIAYTSKMLTVELTMWNASMTQMKALLWAKFMHFDLKTSRSADHSEELMRLFEEIVVLEATKVFEERCQQVLQAWKDRPVA